MNGECISIVLPFYPIQGTCDLLNVNLHLVCVYFMSQRPINQALHGPASMQMYWRKANTYDSERIYIVFCYTSGVCSCFQLLRRISPPSYSKACAKSCAKSRLVGGDCNEFATDVFVMKLRSPNASKRHSYERVSFSWVTFVLTIKSNRAANILVFHTWSTLGVARRTQRSNLA